MKRFYFGGIEKRKTAEYIAKEHAAGMMSQLQYSPTLMAACNDIEWLVMDSGAFSKPLSRQDIERYAALIVQLGDRCVWYANADKIGDQAQSNENYRFLLSLLPSELHGKILWIYQYGSAMRYLYAGLEQHQHIGIGGLVPLIAKNHRSIATHAIARIAQIVAERSVTPHYFGVSVSSIVAMLHGYHDDFSVDSTTWLVAGRYGQVVTENGAQVSAEAGMTKEQIFARNIQTMRGWIEDPQREPIRLSHIQAELWEVTA